MNSRMPTSRAAKADSLPAAAIDLKLEVVVLPVADVDRALTFYRSLGWRQDADIRKGEGFRVVQFTPPGSACSIHFGVGLTSAVPGSVQGTYLVVSDIEAARAALRARGAKVSEIFHRAPGEPSQRGRDPSGKTYSSYATFMDPDGNSWTLQEITSRLPGRISAEAMSFASVADLTNALQRAAAAHAAHEKKLGKADPEWPAWYAQYLASEQRGEAAPA